MSDADDDDIIGPSFAEMTAPEVQDETHDDRKRTKSSSDTDEADNKEKVSDVGPTPKKKLKRVLPHEELYLKNLPDADYYEISYMHRNTISHIVSSSNGYFMTASVEGHFRFWRKTSGPGVEFVKHFRAHLGEIYDVVVSPDGDWCCTIGDTTMKVFDVINFDMSNMIKLNFTPYRACWIYATKDPVYAIALADKNSPNVRVYDARGTGEVLHTFTSLHVAPVKCMVYNSVFDCAVSADSEGMLEYWSGPKYQYGFPPTLQWEYKSDTDLYELARSQTHATAITVSPNGLLLAIVSTDRKIRIFNFLTGKLNKVIDESLQIYTELQQRKQQIPTMEFGRRLAVEKEFERSSERYLANILFDESSNFLVYATLLGVKVVNLISNTVARCLGRPENLRFLCLALWQHSSTGQTALAKPGLGGGSEASLTLEQLAAEASGHGSENNISTDGKTTLFTDPLLLCTAFKKNRFYIFSRREPLDIRGESGERVHERDRFNEKPTKEEIMAAATQGGPGGRQHDSAPTTAILHTSLGDIHVKLFPKECPKTIENFAVHSRKGYYNGHVFHRVIKGFMVQTGCPRGNGTGGESIWGGEFEDEFHPSLRHDRPYTLSMANAGPNTNGSQFFITVAPTPWLDNKHTIFGRVTKGMEVVQKISVQKTNPKTDKPYDDITLISVTIK